MRILVTGLFEPASLHVIRRFGELGHEVYAAEGHRLAFAGFSKHVKQRIRLPNMRYHPRAYAARLLEELESGRYDYYFPGYEEIILMSHFRDRINAVTRTAIPETRTLMTLHDKVHLAALAQQVGIDTPITFAPKSHQEAAELIDTVELPVVIKMRQTSGAAGFRKVYDRAELKKRYDEVVRINKLQENDLPMIQQLIEGPTTCTLELCRAGTVLGDVMYRGLRTMPRTGGTTVFRESISDPACREAVDRIVAYLDYTGFCGFDFVIDQKTGRPFLVDGNCRITPAVTMSYHGGCDMVEAWLRLAAGEDVARLPESKIGVRTKLQFGDFVWLLESYLGSFKDWSGEHRQRKAWWREHSFYYDIHDFRDLMPNVMVWVYIFANLYKLVFTEFDSAQLFIFHNQYVEPPEGLNDLIQPATSVTSPQTP